MSIVFARPRSFISHRVGRRLFAVVLGVAVGVANIASAASVPAKTASTGTTYTQQLISGFSPKSGPAGTVVTISGSGLSGTTVVWLGADKNLPFTVVSDSQMRVTISTKATSAGFNVLSPQYSSFSPYRFRVTTATTPPPPLPPPPAPIPTPPPAPTPPPVPTPSISGFTPASGPVGTQIVVSGSGFTAATTAQVGASSPAPVSVVNDTQVSFVVPADATSGKVFIGNTQTSGSSGGNFSVTTPTTTPPPPPPPVTPPPSSGGTIGQLGAARLLSQGTFGATLSSIASTSTQTYDQWFAAQVAAPTTYTAASVPANGGNWLPLWWRNVVSGQDQLRQRVAFGLSEIFVASDQSAAVQFSSRAVPAYHDVLVRNAFGNFRSLLEQVTLSPTMGLYLNMLRSDKANPATGSHADQNYAREIMQLFTVGLVKLNLDGSVQKDANGNGLPTYGQADVENLAMVFTGWGSAPLTQTGEGAWTYDTDIMHPMVGYESHHDTAAKTLIGGVAIPAGGTTASDLKIALDTLFNHPNVGPFLGKALIQRLVTSNPSPAYVQRVASAFNNNGAGVRGDMAALVKAILTDPEAITPRTNDLGKLREPLLRLANLWRAFNASDAAGNFNEYAIVQDAGTSFAQSPLDAPTVFNFFQSDYMRSGPLAVSGMVAPEFQITNESTLVLTANQLERQAYAFTDSTGKTYFTPNGYSETPGSVLLKTADWEGFAATPATLVDQLNLVLMAGQMPAAMKTTLTNYVAGIPSTDAGYLGYRAAEAADLIINSSQYSIQH